MLSPAPFKSHKITKAEQTGNSLIMYSDTGLLRLIPVTDKIIRITYTEKDSFSDEDKPGVILPEAKPSEARTVSWDYSESEACITLSTPELIVDINRITGTVKYYNHNHSLLLAEREKESRILDEFQAYILSSEMEVTTERIQTADGVKELVKEAARKPLKKLYHSFLHLDWQDDEALYGLGQNSDGILNLRGQRLYLHQANMKICIPLLVSTKGYGILTDTYSPMIFSDDSNGSYIYSEAVNEMDFYFIKGTPDEVVNGYRTLTGKAAMLPKWAFGFIQSQERYETQDEIVNMAAEYRKRGLGLDCLVLDWLSWPDGMWGQKSFDPKRFPDPRKMTDELHDMNVHFMISIWPNMCKESENNKEMSEADGLLPASDLYNPLKEEARKVYWNQLNRAIFSKGVDAFWCDSSEPITVEWVHRKQPEASASYYEYVKQLEDHIPADYTNAYPLFHARTIYEGQRSTETKKRVCNLTRCAYTGQQRYGTIMWSGDISASWTVFKKQIAGALNFSASGFPYWTVDVGGFFIKKGDCWYWNGDFDGTNKDKGYLELYTRMYQWAAFLPVMRCHGTDCKRELWAFENEDMRFYNALVKANELRYKLMPYIYSMAAGVYFENKSIIRMLGFEYPDDVTCHNIDDQYFFGDSLMICPVTFPIYYAPGNTPLNNEATRKVYLPAGDNWYDFYSHVRYEGGQWITVDAQINHIPVFVKEGSIIPTNIEKTTYANAPAEIEWLIFPGKDAEFKLYEDSGDGYGYETGDYMLTTMYWDENQKEIKKI